MFTLSIISGIKSDLVTRTDEWKNYYDSNDHENSQLLNPWHDGLNEFQRILVIRAIRPDRVIPHITKLVAKELGEKYVNPPPFDIQKSYGDSTCLNPLIFVLSPGSDPVASLLQFADKMGKAESLKTVSMGQGQVNNDKINRALERIHEFLSNTCNLKGPIAESVIRSAQKTGGWVCLQNVHLADLWMEKLEVVCDSFDATTVNGEFRLWLTSYSSDKVLK